MALPAYARLPGRPGVCLVTRGPGATNASAGEQAGAFPLCCRCRPSSLKTMPFVAVCLQYQVVYM